MTAAQRDSAQCDSAQRDSAQRDTQHSYTQAFTQITCSPMAARSFGILLSINELHTTAHTTPTIVT